MGNLLKHIESFEKEFNRINKEVMKVCEKSVFVHGIYFHPSMNLTTLVNEDVNLGHTLLHKFAYDKKPLIAKELIQELHTKFSEEVVKRFGKHHSFDKLDEITTSKDNL